MSSEHLFGEGSLDKTHLNCYSYLNWKFKLKRSSEINSNTLWEIPLNLSIDFNLFVIVMTSRQSEKNTH
jgi:hypothetical protein